MTNNIHGAELYDKNVQLQKENEELKAGFKELYNNAEQLANKYNKYGGNKENELVEIINKTTDERNKYKQENKKLKAENEQLKKPCLVMPKVNQLAVPIEKYEKLYKALEEIRSYCDEQNLKADYTACYITNRIDEVLKDV